MYFAFSLPVNMGSTAASISAMSSGSMATYLRTGWSMTDRSRQEVLLVKDNANKERSSNANNHPQSLALFQHGVLAK